MNLEHCGSAIARCDPRAPRACQDRSGPRTWKDQTFDNNDIRRPAFHSRAEDQRLPSIGLGHARRLVGELLVDMMLAMDSGGGQSQPSIGVVNRHLRFLTEEKQRRSTVCGVGKVAMNDGEPHGPPGVHRGRHQRLVSMDSRYTDGHTIVAKIVGRADSKQVHRIVAVKELLMSHSLHAATTFGEEQGQPTRMPRRA